MNNQAILMHPRHLERRQRVHALFGRGVSVLRACGNAEREEQRLGKPVDLVSVGNLDPATGRLTVDEGAIVWPGNAKGPPQR